MACGRGGEVVVVGRRRTRSRVRGAGERDLAGQREEPARAGGGEVGSESEVVGREAEREDEEVARVSEAAGEVGRGLDPEGNDVMSTETGWSRRGAGHGPERRRTGRRWSARAEGETGSGRAERAGWGRPKGEEGEHGRRGCGCCGEGGDGAGLASGGRRERERKENKRR